MRFALQMVDSTQSQAYWGHGKVRLTHRAMCDLPVDNRLIVGDPIIFNANQNPKCLAKLLAAATYGRLTLQVRL